MTNCSERFPFRYRASSTTSSHCNRTTSNMSGDNTTVGYQPFSDEKLTYNDHDIESQQPYHTKRFSKYRVFGKFAFLVGFVYLILNHTPLNSFDSIDTSFGGKEFNITELSDAFLNVLTHTNLAGNWSKKYTAEPHLGGTNYGLVQFTADKFEEYGFESTVHTFNSYINYPGEYSLKLLKPTKNDFKVVYQPTLVEDGLEEDPTTRGEGLIPAFHGYSANGNVTGPLVFANYGTKEDFRLLEEKNVNVTGSVVIVRYGNIFRGLKIKFAQEAGAIGVIIYSDPADDYIPDDVDAYPKGPGRNPSSIQRGSVQFLSSLPGDPTRFTDRSPEALANLSSIPRIPSLPISFKEAEPILATLNGHGLDLGFKGGISSFDYTTGPSHHQVNLYNNNPYKFTDLWNVLGLYEGHDSNEVIVIGNHRDAWIKGGASDPNSGSSSLLEVARGLGELFNLGWKPQKSILLASWDGEEYGLLGSTAYAEEYAAEIGKKVVGYINCDVSVSGSHLSLSASPIMNKFLLDVADQVKFPKQKGVSLKEHFLSERNISILGSGSDFTSFYEHLGVPSVDLGFSAGKGDAVYHYHSNYDSHYWMSTFGDPGFKLHSTAAQYIGLLAINLSEGKVLQAYKAKDYSKAILGYFKKLADSVPEPWLHQSVILDEEDFDHFHSDKPHGCGMMRGGAVIEGKKHNATLAKLINSTYEDIYGFVRVAKKHDRLATALQSEWDEDVSKSKNPFKKFIFNRRVKNANNKLKHLEKEFLYEPGLNGREWFKHVVFASGRYTGYAGQSLPGLTEALEDNDFEQTVRWIKIIKKSIKKGLVSLVV